MMDCLMVATLLGLVWLLIKWCGKQVENDE